MKKVTILLSILVMCGLLISSCSRDKKAARTGAGEKQQDTAGTQAQLPTSDRYYVLDRRQKTIYEIDLNNNKVSGRFLLEDNVVAIAYDMARDWIYEAIGEPKPGLKVFSPKANRQVQAFQFPEPPSDILFHPLRRHLYITSEDSTYFRIFSPDSMKFLFGFPLWVVDRGMIGPKTISPGPAGKLITANGRRASVTQIVPDSKYAYQTITIKEAASIDNAAFSFDGNSCFVCDSKQGILYHLEFGSGDILAKKEGLDDPRLVQFEVNSRTVVVAVGKNTVLMLNPETFAETGRVSLQSFGDTILYMTIPPKANYVELLMDYKGVTRWMRLAIDDWEPLRLVELI